MAYTYQHYPLAMYRNGVYRAVSNEAEEATAAAEGFTDYVSDREGRRPEPHAVAVSVEQPAHALEPTQSPALPIAPAKRKPGRPKKA